MNNAEKFKQIFGLRATELWSMRASDLFTWLERDVEITQPDHIAESDRKVSISCGQENDLISRREALNAITDELMQSTPLSAVIRAKNRLRDLSAVQPERIRCKDCKYWRDDHTCHEHSLVSPMCANEYCSRAERRTDERFD